MGRPSSVDGGISQPAHDAAGRYPVAWRQVVQRGAVQVAVQRVEPDTARRDVAQDHGGTVVEALAVVRHREDRAVQRGVNLRSGGSEEVQSQVNRSRLRSVVALRLEAGRVVQKARFAVAAHADGGARRRDRLFHPADSLADAGGFGRVRQVRACRRKVQHAGPGQHLGRHDRRPTVGAVDPRRHGAASGVGLSAARPAHPKLRQAPVQPGQPSQKRPRRRLAHGQVLVIGLLPHLASLYAHRQAEAQRGQRQERPALRRVQPALLRIAAGHGAGRLQRVRQIHHGVGCGHCRVGDPPPSRHVAEVDDARQARRRQRRIDQHVVVVGVVVHHAAGQVAHRSAHAPPRSVRRPPNQRGLGGSQPLQVRRHRLPRRLEPPWERALQARVTELRQRRPEFGKEGAQRLQHGRAARPQLRQRDPLHPHERRRHAGTAPERHVHHRRRPPAGAGHRPHQARNASGQTRTADVPDARSGQLQGRTPLRRTDLQHHRLRRHHGLRRPRSLLRRRRNLLHRRRNLLRPPRNLEVQVELAGKGVRRPLDAEDAARDRGSLRRHAVRPRRSS